MTPASSQTVAAARPAEPDINGVLGRALAYIRAGEAQNALACLTGSPEVTRGHYFACYLTGLIYASTGRDAEALSFYDRALALQPSYTEVIEGRARILSRLGRAGEVIESYEALLRLQPANPSALYKLGIALDIAGRKAEALNCYNRSLEAAPGPSTGACC